MKRKILISFFGPSGVGKSSCLNFAGKYLESKGCEVFHVNVAYPLRSIQAYAYKVFGKGKQCPDDANFKQDGRLLGFLAQHFEDRLGPTFELEVKRVLKDFSGNNIAIVNTDCRNNAHKTLKRLGFVFVKIDIEHKILKERREKRGDLTPFNHKSLVEQIDKIIPSHTIANDGTLTELKKAVCETLDKILK